MFEFGFEFADVFHLNFDSSLCNIALNQNLAFKDAATWHSTCRVSMPISYNYPYFNGFHISTASTFNDNIFQLLLLFNCYLYGSYVSVSDPDPDVWDSIQILIQMCVTGSGSGSLEKLDPDLDKNSPDP
jgi:hypothetical protein